MTPGQEAYEKDRIEGVSLEWERLGELTQQAYETGARRHMEWKGTIGGKPRRKAVKQ